MKQRQLSILAASLVAAFAVNGAYAGQISSTANTLAREVLVSNVTAPLTNLTSPIPAQIIRAPQKTYTFAGDIDPRANTQRMQVQLQLQGDPSIQWAMPATYPVNRVGGAGASGSGVTVSYTDGTAIDTSLYTVSTYIDPTGKILYANIEFPQNPGFFVTKPVISFNPGAIIGGNNTGIKNLYAVAGATTCAPATIPDVMVTFRHYTTFIGSTLLTDAAGQGLQDSEHLRAGSTNDARLIAFTENLSLTLTPSAGTLNVDGTTQKDFTGTAPTFINGRMANLGTVKINQVSNGFDTDYATQYGSGIIAVTTPATAAAPNAAAGTLGGTIEAKSLDVVVNAGNGGAFASGTMFFSTAADCSVQVGTVSNVAYPATSVTIRTTNATDIAAARATPLNVCYAPNGTSVLPQTTVAGFANLMKSPSSNVGGVASYNEQNNSCPGSLANIGGGGVKIDVRNYSTSKNTGVWQSVIRLINPSETNTATVYGQLIHADGSYGGWGTLTTLAPRAAKNMFNTDIDAKLTGAPACNGATGCVTGTLAGTPGSLGERLRITTDGVSSLRVQNFLYNTVNNNFMEVSGSQGVDFDATGTRSPDRSQTISQDAQAGLAK
jgi:hypothetical protein